MRGADVGFDGGTRRCDGQATRPRALEHDPVHLKQDKTR